MAENCLGKSRIEGSRKKVTSGIFRKNFEMEKRKFISAKKGREKFSESGLVRGFSRGESLDVGKKPGKVEKRSGGNVESYSESQKVNMNVQKLSRVVALLVAMVMAGEAGSVGAADVKAEDIDRCVDQSKGDEGILIFDVKGDEDDFTSFDISVTDLIQQITRAYSKGKKKEKVLLKDDSQFEKLSGVVDKPGEITKARGDLEEACFSKNIESNGILYTECQSAASQFFKKLSDLEKQARATGNYNYPKINKIAFSRFLVEKKKDTKIKLQVVLSINDGSSTLTKKFDIDLNKEQENSDAIATAVETSYNEILEENCKDKLAEKQRIENLDVIAPTKPVISSELVPATTAEDESSIKNLGVKLSVFGAFNPDPNKWKQDTLLQFIGSWNLLEMYNKQKGDGHLGIDFGAGYKKTQETVDDGQVILNGGIYVDFGFEKNPNKFLQMLEFYGGIDGIISFNEDSDDEGLNLFTGIRLIILKRMIVGGKLSLMMLNYPVEIGGGAQAEVGVQF